jgi:tetrahydromethanopterin S-methyltransferase subunit B
MENYRVVLTNISSNLGIKSKVPSLEDFKNPYGTQASHEIAVESFFSSIKAIWEKIKEVFMAFFKKISVFFKRLTNAQLDLDTYEEYLETMIAKIKAKKMVISDNKVIIDSKLPSLLANPGMESINSDFVLITGENKIKRLTIVANGVFSSALEDIGERELKTLKEKIKEGIRYAGDPEFTIDHVRTFLDGLRELSINGLGQIFNHSVDDIRDLPETVYNAAAYQFDRDELENVRIFSLVDGNNFNESLPKNFNSYYIMSGNEKVFVSSSVETNTYVENKLLPISNANNLVKFYEFYKKSSKNMDIKKIDKSINKFQDGIEDIVGIMKRDYVEILEKLHRQKHESRQSNRITTVDDAVHALVNFFNELERQNPNDKSVVLLMNDMTRDLNIPMEPLYRICNNEDPENNYRALIVSIEDESEFISKTKAALAGKTNEKVIDIEDIEEMIKEFEKFQKFLLNFLNSLQTTLKEVSVNLAGTFVELRYEFARYLYNSAKLYTST